jgi:hypothetical protein
MPESEAKEQSEFNDALGYLRRINGCLFTADSASMNLDAHAWFMALLAFYRELSTEISPEKMTEFRATITDLNNEISHMYSPNNKGKLSNVLYFKLSDFEVALRKIYDDAGLQMKRKEDRRFGL